MVVSIGNITVIGINAGNDATSHMAIALAEATSRWFNDLTDAIVDRDAGLVVFRRTGQPMSGNLYTAMHGFHFVNALCGYTGSGPIATATILEIFGFGEREELLEQICTGGDGARYRFIKGARKPVAMV